MTTKGQEAALQALKEASKKRDEARLEYNAAIISCQEHHVSKTMMASVVGVTESAIRMYIKRNRL